MGGSHPGDDRQRADRGEAVTRLRCWLDARALERALRVFFRRQWHDLPAGFSDASVTVEHLEYRINALRGRP